MTVSEMSPRVRFTVFVTLVASLVSCAGDPLPGTWTASTTTGTITLATTLVLNADGTVRVTDAGRGTCTGSRTYTGLTWSSSPTVLAFAGVAACTGAVTCVVGTMNSVVGCPASPSAAMTSACGYALSADGNTLTLSNCSGSAGTSTAYVRAAN